MDIPDLLKKMKLVGDEDCAPGDLKCSVESVPSPAAALERLRAFGGEGWYCGAESPEVRRFSPDSPLAAHEADWPISAEAANGSKSLHLLRSGEAWKLATIERATDGGVLMTARLLSRDGKGNLRYEVSWSSVERGGLKELRPSAFRFVGFEAA